MKQFVLLELVLLIVALHAVARIWRASAVDGVLMLLLPFYSFIAMFKYWRDPDHGIRWHMLVLVVGGVFAYYSALHAEQELLAEQQAGQAALQAQLQAARGAASFDDADAAAGEALAAPTAMVEIGSRVMPPPVAHAARAAPATASIEPPPEPRPSADEVPAARPTAMSLRQAVAAATFQRGRFERAGSAFAIELPTHFHALPAIDARRIEAALGRTADLREVAWIVHESIALDDPSAWHVSVRWLDDGWLAPADAPLDGEALLRAARDARSISSSRLAGSRGALIGYAVAPTARDGVVDWVEERVADDDSGSVLDCHALRPGQRGVLEFSVVAAAPGTQQLCDASVRLLARRTAFDAGRDFAPTPPAGAARAPYSLNELVARLR